MYNNIVEIIYNPYEGLKLYALPETDASWIVEIIYNPYEGLKRMNLGKTLKNTKQRLKSSIIPMRD